MTKQKGKKILITGLPGSGKTTLIKKVSRKLNNLDPTGFYTAEIRERGVRKGFELIGLDGQKGILAHVNIKSRFKVGKYGVDIAGFNQFLDTVELSNPAAGPVIIDEIGKMECLSAKFIGLLNDILNSEKLVIATIALKGSGLIADVKERCDTELFELNQHNRDTLLFKIFALSRVS